MLSFPPHFWVSFRVRDEVFTGVSFLLNHRVGLTVRINVLEMLGLKDMTALVTAVSLSSFSPNQAVVAVHIPLLPQEAFLAFLLYFL